MGETDLDTNKLSFDAACLKLTPADFEAPLGAASGGVPEPFSEVIDEILQLADGLCEIRGAYTRHRVVSREVESMVLECGEFHTGRAISRLLGRSSELACFVCTIGDGIERKAKELMRQGDMVASYAYHTAGSVIVERAMDKIQTVLKEEVELQGLKITNRYSPGYCGWSTNEQHLLFDCVNDTCGIELTEGSLMIPIKSVSGVIGIGKLVKLNPHTCKICPMKDCSFRGKQDCRPAL